MVLAVLIPAYNERELLPRLVERVLATPPPLIPGGEALRRVLVLVDDGSTDGTGEVVRDLGTREGIVAIVHEKNRGKGAAIRTALTAALGERVNADVLIIQDADLEYDPADHAPVLAPILDGRADAVIGSRFLGLSHRVLYYWHAVANGFITRCSNMLTNLNLTDIECCSKAFTRGVAQRITIRENRFGIEPELVARLAHLWLEDEGGVGEVGVTGAGEGGNTAQGKGNEGQRKRRRARVYEVAVSYAGRTYEEGKKITWRDGVRALWCIAKYNLWSRR